MVTFEEAKQLALERYRDFDSYQELRDAYIFWQESIEDDFGWSGEAVAMKDTGEVVGYMGYKEITKEPFEVLREGKLSE